MAEGGDDGDDEDKTEEPSERKLEKAREDGQTVFSKEIISLALMIAMALSFLFVIPWSSKSLAKNLIPYLDRPHLFAIDSNMTQGIFWGVYKSTLWFLAPTFSVLLLLVLSSGLYQKKDALSLKSIAPKFSNLSLKKGFSKIFSTQNLVENLKNIIKLSCFIGLLYWVLLKEKAAIRQWLWISIPDFFKVIQNFNFLIFMTLIIAFGAIAIADYLYQRYAFMKKMKMSKYDMKQEYKEAEGNPEIKAKLRQMRMSKMQERMMEQVPKATVILANPTHYAIALLWDDDNMNAPTVVAKGHDLIAQRIKEVAKANDVPIIENPSLTRALYPMVDLKQEIPPQFYKAVAEVIRIVMRLKNQYF
jgi:flagellar biosynthetic protein FlhB